MDHLHQNYQQDYRTPQHDLHLSLVALHQGHRAQTSRADGPGHGPVAENGDGGGGQAVEQGGPALGQHDLGDNLPGGAAHGLGRLQHAGVQLPEGALHNPGHEGRRRYHQGHNAGRRPHAGAQQNPGQGDDDDHQNQERNGPQQVDRRVQNRHDSRRDLDNPAVFPGHQQHPQRQADDIGQGRADKRGVQRLPDGKGGLLEKAERLRVLEKFKHGNRAPPPQ